MYSCKIKSANWFLCFSIPKKVIDINNKIFTSRDKNNVNCNVIIQKGSYSQTLIYGGCDSEGKLIIPEGVNYIDVEAFRGRLLLKEITLPKSLSAIREYAFDYCKNLKIVNNKSKLDLTLKSNDHGGVAYYAEIINNI